MKSSLSVASATLVLLLIMSGQARAQTVKIPDEYGKLIQSGGEIAGLGPNLFGDQIGLYTGSLAFVQTDTAIPGNNPLPVSVGRRFSPNQTGSPGGHFSDWDLEIPHLHGVFSLAYGWASTEAATPSQRCSQFGRPPALSGSQGGTFEGQEYWQGSFFYLPGSGDHEVLKRAPGVPSPTDGKAYPLVTANGAAISCLPQLAGTSSGQGEGFEVLTPDGTRYRFDQMVGRYATTLSKSNPAPDPFFAAAGTTRKVARSKPAPVTPLVAMDYMLNRQEVWLLPTKVTDRHGNTVTYSWNPSDPWQLLHITSSDGRSLSFTYVTGSHRVATVSDGTHTWTYSYQAVDATYRLQSVTLPDNSAWTFQLEPLRQMTPLAEGGSCGMSGQSSISSRTGVLTHPSGAQGSFTIRPIEHGRSWVPWACGNPDVGGGYSVYPAEYILASLTNKTLSGPALPTGGQSWTYAYGPANNCYQGAVWASVPACTTSSPTSKTVSVTGPDGAVTRHTFGNRYLVDEGQLQRVDIGWTGASALRTVQTIYADPAAGPYPNPIGTSGQIRGNGQMAARHAPARQTITTQDGANFVWQVEAGCGGAAYCFDAWARSTKVRKYSSLSSAYTKTEDVVYHDNPYKWVMGQNAKLTVNGIVTSETSYDANALPAWDKYFGKLQHSYTFKLTAGLEAGTLATVKDGRNFVTAFANWKRGIPQKITYPDAKFESAVVNDDGTIASVTDENGTGYTTNYGYDAMGRLTSINYPDDAGQSYNNTIITFAPSPTAGYGLPAGHWKQTIATGNAHTDTHFDALWRPLVKSTYDTLDFNGTLSQSVIRYDADGRPTFNSYPQRTTSSAIYNTWGNPAQAPNALGVDTKYDALGRTTLTTADSELGALQTVTEYLAGFQTRSTNPRGKQTLTTMYQAYDQPTYDWPRGINHPEGAYTEIYRDGFGKPTLVKRRNLSGSVAATRSYVYDAQQQLCKTIEPETGSTVMSYDAAGNLAWSASGQALTSTTACQDTSVPLASRTVHGYDARNRVTSLGFPDALGNTSYSYTSDGLLESIIADNGGANLVTTNYTYNKRRLPISERMLWGSINWPISYGYDVNGSLASQSWNGLNVTFIPNALGQPTQAGSYATGVSYFPNGAIKQFTYGNGIVHTLTQNARQLPDTSRDAYGTAEVLDDGYDYDQNANVAAISDGLAGARGHRTMTYDSLDRLITVASPMYGAAGAAYTYDVLDNLKTVIAPGRNHTYVYDAKQRLTNVTNTSGGASVIGLGYDVQGNLANKNGVVYDFDYGNRLRSVSGGAGSYVYDGHGRRVRDVTTASKYSLYSRAGQLTMASDLRTATVSDYIHLGGSLVAVRERNTATNVYTTKYQHTDALGSPVAVTNSARTVLERSEYEPYGKLSNRPLKDGPGYTGHVMDAATGLAYMQQRYYDPGIGRFLSVDPVTADGNTVATSIGIGTPITTLTHSPIQMVAGRSEITFPRGTGYVLALTDMSHLREHSRPQDTPIHVVMRR